MHILKSFRKHLSAFFFALSLLCFALAWWLHCRQFVRYIELEPPEGMTQAGLYLSNEIRNPQGILVLADGVNSVGGALIHQEEWRAFARKHRLVLAEIAFASAADFRVPDSKCYYYARNGSGEALLKLLDSRFPQKPPLFLFGFSGGGHFASRFQEWRPDRVRAWAVCGVNWWNEPPQTSPEQYPPGIILIGDKEGNLVQSVLAFQARNTQGRHLLWAGLKDTEHTMPYHALPLVRSYFDALLANPSPHWQTVSLDDLPAGDLPSDAVHSAWNAIPLIPPKIPAPEPEEEEEEEFEL